MTFRCKFLRIYASIPIDPIRNREGAKTIAHSHEGHASCGPGYASPKEAMEKAEREKVLYTMALYVGTEPAGPARAHEMRYPGGDVTSDIWI
jgi:hypothetical protein